VGFKKNNCPGKPRTKKIFFGPHVPGTGCRVNQIARGFFYKTLRFPTPADPEGKRHHCDQNPSGKQNRIDRTLVDPEIIFYRDQDRDNFFSSKTAGKISGRVWLRKGTYIHIRPDKPSVT
jgi:hypothetical protein